MIEVEYPCISLTRCGAKKVLQLFQELRLCSYWGSFDWMYRVEDGKLFPKADAVDWLSHWVPALSTQEGLQFSEKIGIRVAHMFDPSIVHSRLIRPVRDARDCTISNFERLRRAHYPTQAFDVSCFLDIPLVPSQGGILQLGMIEEWLLQEHLLQQLFAPERIFHLSFEELEQQNVSHIESLLTFLGVSRSRDQVEQALAASKADKFDQKENTPRKIARWRDQEYPLINQRFALNSRSISTPHSYELEAGPELPPIASWDAESLENAFQAWISLVLVRAVHTFPGLDAALLVPALTRIAQCFEHLPLVRFQFAKSALEKGVSLKCAKEELVTLVREGSAFLRVVSAQALHRSGDKQEPWHDIAGEQLNALQPEVSKRRHLDEALRAAGFEELVG